MSKKLNFQIVLQASILILAVACGACNSGSVVSDSNPASSNPASGATASQPQTASSQPQSSAAQPAPSQTTAEQAQKPTPSPTLHPVMKEAQAKPGVPIPVPESMRRPLNPEEMKKALEAMPPEVRARIQGMAPAPQAVKPQATPKQ